MPTTAAFIEPMLLLKTYALPDDRSRWSYELKLDGYRAIAFKTGGTLHLRSRNDNDFGTRYPSVIKGLAHLPDDTVIDDLLIGRRSRSADHDALRSANQVCHLVQVRSNEKGTIFRIHVRK